MPDSYSFSKLIYTKNKAECLVSKSVEPDARYRVNRHVTNEYTYASTKPSVVGLAAGKNTAASAGVQLTLIRSLSLCPGFY